MQDKGLSFYLPKLNQFSIMMMERAMDRCQ